MEYTNCLTLKQMKNYDILDEVPYKCLKKHHDDDDIKVYIYHKNDDDIPVGYNIIVFEFELTYNCSKGIMPLYTTKKFKKEITYSTSSSLAYFLTTLEEDDDSDEDDSDNENDSDNEDDSDDE